MPRNSGTAIARLLALFSAACGSDSGGPSNGDSPQVTLTSGLQFSPSDLTIDPGTTVRWVTSTTLFPTAGEFPFACSVHPVMTGRVVVP
ncbi:MAG TPA: hypothetical protein VMK53_05100 [Gemmatimonadales bacterium]|nr:hypothetical protein [Gemmatimonadales bacterium]